MIKYLFVWITLFPAASFSQYFHQNEPFAHTFSIVAMDTAEGVMGIGVQSHWFSVGNVVAWVKSGAGVVATQSFVNKSYGPEGLAMMESGKSAPEVLRLLLQNDPGSSVRQVGIIDKDGNVAAHTGEKCVDFAGHLTGSYFSVQANMMEKNTVPSAMAKAFEGHAALPLAERILKSLNAAQMEGGDIRGKQSAAIRIVRIKPTGESWNDDYVVDLRVDDHENPIQELERLLRVHRAYEHMNAGDLFVENGKMEEAMKSYGAAMTMFPDNLEMQYWTAITLANNGEVKKALPLLKKVYRRNGKWKELTKRLPKAGLLSVSDSDFKQMTE
jgi:uncharacterized Ntn-hydrolase superfamily protein